MISGSDLDVGQGADFRTVAIAACIESPLNTRKHFDEQALAELTESVRQKGVLVPLLVREHARNSNMGDRGFEILAGARRFRAATAAGLNGLPVRVVQVTDDEALEIIVLENLQREDVHPLEEAEGYRALLERSGNDVAALAAKVGKSESYIYQRLKLLDLTPDAQKAFLAGEITAGHAVLIARLQPKDQKEALEACFNKERAGDKWVDVLCGVRSLALWIENEIHLDLGKVPFDPADPELLAKAGPCTTCPKRTGYSPALFNDMAKKDACTDRECFKAKMAAYVERKKEELKARGEKLVEISEGYNPPKGGKALRRDQYNVAPASGKNTCDDVVRGIMVDGRELGKVITVCTNNQCAKHRGGGYSSGHAAAKPSPAEQKKRRLENLKQRRRGELIRRSFRAVQEAAPTKIAHAEVVSVIKGYFEEMQQNSLVALCAAYGVAVEKHKHQYGGTVRDPRKSLAKWVDGLSEAQATQLLLSLPASRDLDFSPWRESKPEHIHAAASRWGVDLKAVEKAVDAEFREKEQRIKDSFDAKPKKKTKEGKAQKKGGGKGLRARANKKTAAGAEASA